MSLSEVEAEQEYGVNEEEVKEVGGLVLKLLFCSRSGPPQILIGVNRGL